jgi:lipoprotein-releasing system permease protein
MKSSLLIHIAWAHVSNRVRQSLIGVLGVATGVGFSIMISGVMQGSLAHFISMLVDAMPHITITDERKSVALQPAEQIYGAAQRSSFRAAEKRSGIANPNVLIASLKTWLPGGIAPSARVAAMFNFGGAQFGVALTGIDPRQEEGVSKLATQMLSGSIYDLTRGSNTIIIGQALANKTGARVGSTVTISLAQGRSISSSIVGLYRSGVREIDEKRVYSLMRTAQLISGQPDLVNEIRIQLDDAFTARELADSIENQTGYRTIPWQEANADVLSTFKVQESISYIIMGAMLLASTLAIYSIISTITNEKRHDIAIMKSLGMKEHIVQGIFILEAAMVGCVGIPAGWALGYLLCLGMSHITASNPITDGVLRLPVSFAPIHYVVVGLIALACCAMSAFLPARKASRLHPVDIIRGAS